ncbi:hypothetical protein BN1012_Phect2507 [Candidatus Phaeomarinobacter ectocarpi]|uniref:Uncharacterized protein n=1 Tax=Candidatus Phaeomarinibacter ectocarpi TaxID=1458461 RepID=X5MMV4_9HYPH|nr:hypothetical protein BN1012_Phect2507 [Candidatus Phaeomarinobacter ectocarpi]
MIYFLNPADFIHARLNNPALRTGASALFEPLVALGRPSTER